MADREYRWHGVVSGEPRTMVESDRLLVVRVTEMRGLGTLLAGSEWRDAVAPWRPRMTLRDQGLVLLESKKPQPDRADEIQGFLREREFDAVVEPGLVFVDTKAPALVTRRIHVRFTKGSSRAEVDEVLGAARADGFRFTLKRVRDAERFAFDLTTTAETTTAQIFGATDALNKAGPVRAAYAHLGLRFETHAASEEDWTLRSVQRQEDDGSWVIVQGHASVVAAWSLTRGRRWKTYNLAPFCRPVRSFRRMRVAVLDMGIDIDHPEFAGWKKVVAPANFFDSGPLAQDPRPQADGEEHGTIMAGLAVGRGKYGASGTAPAAALIPIRMLDTSRNVTTDGVRKAFDHARLSKADVISCSWSGDDPTPDTATAISNAATLGRGGKGCVIVFAAGNSNKITTTADNPFASRADVIAVGACNVDGAPVPTSPPGDALWCLFPTASGAFPKDPVWVVDATGPFSSASAGDYMDENAGGTSHACAATAGVAALILARNPALTREEVKDLIADTCDKVDQGSAVYGATGKSTTHGYGRVHALRAVMAAL